MQELIVHTVTKILVVFAAILAVLLAALTMAYSVNASRITDQYRAVQDAESATRTLAQQQVADANTVNVERQKQIEAMAGKTTEIENKVRALEGEKGQLMAQVRSVEADRDAIRAMIDQLGATGQTQAALIKSYRDEVTKLRENELGYRRKEIELVDRLNDVESQLEVSQANTRALQEQLVEVRRNLETAGGAVRTGDTATSASTDPYRPSFTVTGKVITTGKDVNGKTTATINLGTNNRVKENMKLSVVRGDKFIANLVIFRTDLQQSIGEIESFSRAMRSAASRPVKQV
jgi:uncharacterized protein (DUF305 family)